MKMKIVSKYKYPISLSIWHIEIEKSKLIVYIRLLRQLETNDIINYTVYFIRDLYLNLF